ncbi:hypothetical protein [Sphingobacterium psychroaquaticum]|uniref:SH3 domain-containing protein n=1 Tax=Sphingobacterium psychroaquaticum TaxID=561061 RepID=A0A1X7KQY8_9SPHI|nr:hypothetical protein [Sphingobacterium psychroaquaticum]SMG43989.1 hypothetical protein SAMN05660862_3152 [Sphingobacterium psychroaquaticum]
MIRSLIAILICVCSLSGHAQQDEPAAYAVNEEFNLWNKNKGDMAYVFADVAYIRDNPGLYGKVIDSLQVGAPVIIRSEGYNTMMIKDFYAPWHKIEYLVGSSKKEGFIWLGLLAFNINKDNEGNIWLYGFNKYMNRSNDESTVNLCEVKLLDKNTNLIAKTSYLVTMGGQTYTDAKVFGNMGLEGIRAIHRVGFHGEACGISTEYYYIGWTGSDFVRLPGKSSVSDAGVFYYNEKLLFPSEHNLDPTLIIKDIEEGEVIDIDAEELEYKIKKKRTKYLWNGQVASEIIEMK